MAEQHKHQLGKIDGSVSEDIKSETGEAIQNMTQNQGEDQQVGAGEPGNDSTGSGQQQQQPTQIFHKFACELPWLGTIAHHLVDYIQAPRQVTIN